MIKMISIVVITYNRANKLKRCVELLLKQSYKHYEIIIVDDGSTDNTIQVIKGLTKKAKVIRYFKQENKGRGAARNLGIKKAKGTIVIFTDDDCIVPRDWLKRFKNVFENHKDITAVGGAIVNGDKNPFGEAAYILNFSSWFPVGKKRYLNDIPTANAAYKKEFIKNKTFPKDMMGLDYEDTAFNFEFIRKGQKILFDPSIKILHKSGISDYKDFIKNQYRKGLSFTLRGYNFHGLLGKLLIKFKILNLFCPRLIKVFLRCLKSQKYFLKFLFYSPLIFRGELERSLTIIKNAN